MKITVLGCGTSGGVPTITGNWGDCDPKNPKNYRTRQSVALEFNDKVVLIDTTPDMRTQCLRENIQTIDAVLYTHEHADHTHGIDDLRQVVFARDRQKIPIYGDAFTVERLHKKFSYLFPRENESRLYPPLVEPHIITEPFDLFGKTIIPFEQGHGKINSLGYRIDNFAYSTDLNYLGDQALETLKGIDVWLVDCLQYKTHATHAWLDKTLEWIEVVQPKQAFFIHMNHSMDYETLCKSLPEHIRPAYDGLSLSLS